MASKYDVSCNFVSVRESVSNYSNHGWVDGDAINGDKIVRKWKGEDRGTCRGKSPHLLETRWNITRDRAFNPLNYSEGHTKIFDPCTCDSSSFQIFFNFSNASILLSFSFLIFISNRFSLSLSLSHRKREKGNESISAFDAPFIVYCSTHFSTGWYLMFTYKIRQWKSFALSLALYCWLSIILLHRYSCTCNAWCVSVFVVDFKRD